MQIMFYSLSADEIYSSHFELPSSLMVKDVRKRFTNLVYNTKNHKTFINRKAKFDCNRNHINLFSANHDISRLKALVYRFHV
jgi:hypothetical protein